MMIHCRQKQDYAIIKEGTVTFKTVMFKGGGDIGERQGKRMDFYKRVELVCSRIPNGTVASYGQIALLCGMPKHARQVGFALNRNLAGEQAPAHRVVNARGVLSGAASFETYEMQKLFLEKEGVTVAKGREGWQVDLKKYGWKPDMKEAVWLREEFLRRGI